MEKQAIQQLITRYWEDALSDEEQHELLQLLQNNESDVLEVLNELQAIVEKVGTPVDPALMKQTLKKVLLVDKVKHAATPVVHVKRAVTKRWWWVAASLFIVAALTVYYNLVNQLPAPVPVWVHVQDVSAPVANRAMITLADGSQVYLDSAGNGQLAQLGNIKLVKLANGQIAYQTGDGKIVNELQYNTLTNPRGSKVIDMQLSDGTHVWLNAGSSITYPVAFSGNERKVVLRGEGYFEVKKHDAKKFIVEANGTTTEVLGTHFNINAYTDEPVIKVTLLEGAVRLVGAKPGEEAVLHPGRQALVSSSTFKLINADLDQVMAWKNGFFAFKNASLPTVMQQIARWYDVDIVYQGAISKDVFTGEIDNSISLKKLLDNLAKASINYTIEGKKLIIMTK